MDSVGEEEEFYKLFSTETETFLFTKEVCFEFAEFLSRFWGPLVAGMGEFCDAGM